MENFYEKNLEAIKEKRQSLYESLIDIDENTQFEVFMAESQEYANILDTVSNTPFYVNPKEDVEKECSELETYREHSFLYLLGVGNGKLIESLLSNKKLTQLMVIEPNIELIYILFNLLDLSADLKTNRLVVLDYAEVNYTLIIDMFYSSNARFYIRSFHLLFNGTYYEKLHFQEYKELMSLFIKVIEYTARASGNDVNDTFRGLKQHIDNIDLMLEYPNYQQLMNKKYVETAVVVSTGPSLNKQLELLKEYQDRVCILSVDASYPILEKHGIKADFVFSMERDEPTAKFFRVMNEKEQEDVIMVCASLQHKEVFKAIKTDNVVVPMRPFAYNIYFGLDDYGYLCKGMSSANMAYEFASSIGFKQTILIGQDLSYGKELKHHADGYSFEGEAHPVLEQAKLIDTEAYGGDGYVQTNVYWKIFMNFYEQHIQESKHFMTTFNATEGGARIAGSIERPFKDLLEEFAKEKKEIVKLDFSNAEEIKKLKKYVHGKIAQTLIDTKALQEDVNKSFLIIAEECKAVENKSIDEAVEIFDIGKTMILLEEISRVRGVIENSTVFRNFLSSIMQPLLYSMEVEIADIKVRFIDNPRDNQIKALQWILAHRYWLFSFSGIIENVGQILKNYEDKD